MITPAAVLVSAPASPYTLAAQAPVRNVRGGTVVFHVKRNRLPGAREDAGFGGLDLLVFIKLHVVCGSCILFAE